MIGMMQMNKVELTRLRIASLSVFRGILTRSVPRAFYRLLSSLDKPPEQFLECYGEFYSLISERGCSDKLAYAMTEAALFDENCATARLFSQPPSSVPTR